MDIRSNIAEAAEYLRVSEEQLQQWRETKEDGPNYTSLRCGGAWYELRDLKIYLREQMEARKAATVKS